MTEEGPVELPLGKVIGKRWKIIEKLGEGGCGAVYKVEESNSHARAALKAESNFAAGGSVLKLEVQVLQRMKGRKFVSQLIQCGKKERYCYMVMTLLGVSLAKLFSLCKKQFTPFTQVRIAIHILYGIKQLHEVGYIHRDIKPANLALGLRGASARVMHLLDFGLAREYVKRSKNTVEMRQARSNTLFRGTLKYCSAQTHNRTDQGRADDLWSMLYVLAEFRAVLPWDRIYERNAIFNLKNTTLDTKLFANSPEKYVEVASYLRTLTYYSRPDYHMIYQKFMDIMKERHISFSEPYDWEKLQNSSPLESESPPNNALVSKTATKFCKRFTNVMTISEDISIANSDGGIASGKKQKMGKSTSEANLGDELFQSNDFARNELGF